MIRYLKITSIVGISAIALLYASLAGYLWISESAAPKNIPQDSLRISSTEDHDFILINSGMESLKRRIDAIDSAKETIELEYFIYELDLAAQIVSYKLIEAARRGVRVKVLVDSSAPVFKLRPEYAQYLKNENIEVKYYNVAPVSSFIEVQHRNHRKFLIIDSTILITGGRNIGNDYFDLSDHYNFLDSDVEINGPIVQQVRESYMHYWESEFSQDPGVPEQVTNLDFVDIRAIEALIEKLAAMKIQPEQFVCSDIDFVTDSPGLAASNRKIYPYIEGKLKSVQTDVVAESPYFVLREDGLNLMKTLHQRGIKHTYLTNSLHATDAYYTVSAMATTLDDLKETGSSIHLYNGATPGNSEVRSRWGLHAKRAVFDSRHTLIGTYNIDPRSANLNSEVLIACNNNEPIAQATLKSMAERRRNAWPLFTGNTAPLSSLTRDASLSQKLKFYLIMPVASLFNFLL